MLEVRLLDGLSAAVDGEPVELPADARARELLARLALTPGPHARSALAGRLRPDVGEESARKTLRNALYELRRALGPAADGALIADAQQVTLAGAVAVDVRTFRRLITAGDLVAAVDAGRGDLLAGFDGEWALRARDEHTADMARVLGELAAGAEAGGDLAGAAGWARRRVDAEPWSEDAHRELVRLLAAKGDRPAALAAAAALTERLRAEFGIPPSAATRALVEEIRRGRAAVPAPSVEPLPLPAGLAGTPAPAGRDAALATLTAAWPPAALRLALLTGEAGIGKSTLAAALARRVHAEGATVLLGRSDEHALVPFQPWVEALEGVLAGVPPATAEHWLGAQDGALARLLPARTPSGAPPAGPRERYLAFELVRALLDELAARRPVLLVLDDVHWADADSLALLRHVARAAASGRLFVLLCARPWDGGGVLATALADLERVEPLVRVELGALDEAAVEALVARHRPDADGAAARRFRERSGGNPFFLGELLRAGDALDGPPAGVRDVLVGRLARLSPATRDALEVAAICGPRFDAATVAAIQEGEVLGVLEALDQAIAAALVAPADTPGRYAFRHALVPEAIASQLAPSRRARLHLRAADLLAGADEDGARAGELVRHLRGAAPLVEGPRLAAWEVAAAREAAVGFAHADAAEHYEAALAAASDDPRRGELLLALGRARDRAGRREGARIAFADAAEAAQAAGDRELLARAALGHGGVGVVIAAADPITLRLLEQALAATRDEDAALASRLRARLAVELYYEDRSRALDLSAQAIEQARAANDPFALAAAWNARRAALWSPQHAEQRLAAADAMIAVARRAGDRESELQGRNWRVVDLLEQGRIADAAAEIDAYALVADALGLPHFQWYVPLWRGTLAMLGGRWQEADACSARALELGLRADDANAELFASIQREHAQQVRGHLADIDRDRLLTGAATSPVGAQWLAHVALLDADCGRVEQAGRLIADLTRDGCAALTMDANWHGCCILAEAAATIGDREAAAALHDLLAPHAELWPVIARGVATLGPADAVVGRLALLLGRADEAVARLRRAVAASDAAGAEPHAAAALLRLGEALRAAGDDGGARDTLQQAAARSEALGIGPLAAQAGHLLSHP